MARILYGVAGEGSGHASRSKIIVEHLLKNDHEVKIVSHDRGYENLSQYFPVEQITGLRFHYKNNSVYYLSTILKNLFKFPQAGASMKRVLGLFDSFKPQLVFSDFEPISAAGALIKKIPLISIDNQHIITHTNVDFPPKYRTEALLAKQVIKYAVPRAKAYFITTFFDAPIKDKRTNLFPPILRSEVLTLQPTEENFILVYITSQFEGLLETLAHTNKQYIVYGLPNGQKMYSNMIYKTPSQKEFLEDLRTCRAIIATAGFSLLSEALYLGKPYLALPVKKQFEQILNAYYLQKQGYGMYTEKLKTEDIETFIARLETFKNNLKNYPKEDNSKIFSAVDATIKQYAN